MEGTFEQFITVESDESSPDVGKERPLDVFRDPHNTFPIGGFGFRTVGSERFQIDDMFVTPR